MSEQKQEGQKTVVAFIVGLLIGGLLVWSFSGSDDANNSTNQTNNNTQTEVEANDAEDNEDGEDNEVTEPVTTTPEPTPLPTGDGEVTVASTEAGRFIPLESATFPVAEGWVGVRDYNNGQLGGILGVVRFSESQGLVPTQIVLQRATQPGREYAVVFYTEDGDRQFNLATDVQIEGIFATFTAE